MSDATTVAWLLLVVATGVGWWLGQAGQANAQQMALATAGVIVVAFIKVWHTFDAWIITVCVALLFVCLP